MPVILDAAGLSIEEMQKITRWMNLSATAFLLPPTDTKVDYRVRIFTLDREMPFAAPDLIRSGPVDDAKLGEIASALEIDRKVIVDAQWADNGPGWVVVLLGSAQAVLDIEPLRDFPTHSVVFRWFGGRRLPIGNRGPRLLRTGDPEVNEQRDTNERRRDSDAQ